MINKEIEEALEAITFSQHEQIIVDRLKKGCSYTQISNLVSKNKQYIHYLVKYKIADKIVNSEKFKKYKKKHIIDLEKEFGNYAYFFGKIFNILPGRTFFSKKMLILHNCFQTKNKTGLNKAPIANAMNKSENGKELPTKLSEISEKTDIPVSEIKQIVKLIFPDNIYIYKDYIVSTKQYMNIIIPNIALIDNDIKLSELFESLLKIPRYKNLLTVKNIYAIESLYRYILFQKNKFSNIPFIKWKDIWENRQYFYKNIVPKNLNIHAVIEYCKTKASAITNRYKINGFSVDMLIDGIFCKDSDIVYSILADSDYFISSKHGRGKNVLLNKNIPFTPNKEITKIIIREFKCKEDNLDCISPTSPSIFNKFPPYGTLKPIRKNNLHYICKIVSD